MHEWCRLRVLAVRVHHDRKAETAAGRRRPGARSPSRRGPAPGRRTSTRTGPGYRRWRACKHHHCDNPSGAPAGDAQWSTGIVTGAMRKVSFSGMFLGSIVQENVRTFALSATLPVRMVTSQHAACSHRSMACHTTMNLRNLRVTDASARICGSAEVSDCINVTFMRLSMSLLQPFRTPDAIHRERLSFSVGLALPRSCSVNALGNMARGSTIYDVY